LKEKKREKCFWNKKRNNGRKKKQLKTEAYEKIYLDLIVFNTDWLKRNID